MTVHCIGRIRVLVRFCGKTADIRKTFLKKKFRIKSLLWNEFGWFAHYQAGEA